jgi:hypothetical protein
MKSVLIAFFIALAAPPAWAADVAPMLQKTPNLAKNAEALPMLVGKTKAIAKINRALRAADRQQFMDMSDCLRDSPQDGYWWEQGVDAPLLGASFVSFLRHGNESCGGAHPNFIMDSLVFDLNTGERADWKKLLPAELMGEPNDAPPTPNEVASPRLQALFVAQSAKESPPECEAEFAQEKLTFQLWPDAKEKGLAMLACCLPHAVEGVCSGPVTISLERLKQLGVNAALVRDIETGRHETHD